jgi:hypothetical protein
LKSASIELGKQLLLNILQTQVTTAASVPSSFTSRKDLCKMLETYKKFLSKFMPDKSAKFMLNKSDAPIMDIISEILK